MCVMDLSPAWAQNTRQFVLIRPAQNRKHPPRTVLSPMTQQACRCPLKHQFILSVGHRCSRVCAFGVQALTLGRDNVIKPIDLHTQWGEPVLPGGLICMDTCGNQKINKQRSIVWTLEQHEADGHVGGQRKNTDDWKYNGVFLLNFLFSLTSREYFSFKITLGFS